jgi:hypothetical protein
MDSGAVALDERAMERPQEENCFNGFYNKEWFMNYGIQVVNGFLMGTGLILAAIVFKTLWHVGFCGG